MAHDDWASQHNITIMYPGHFPTLMLSSHCHTSSHSIMHLHVSPCIFAFLCIFMFSRISAFHRASSHSCASSCSCASSHSIAHLCIPSHIFAFHRASLHSITHLRVSPCIFTFHHDLVRIITGASIHCPASSLVCRIPFITISDYVWHHTIIISLWTLTLHHLHT